MRNFLAFVAATVITVAAIGWYLDWFRITPVPTSPGHQSLQVDINSKKIGDDFQKGVQQGREKINDLLDEDQAGRPAEDGDAAKTSKVRVGHQEELQERP